MARRYRRNPDTFTLVLLGLGAAAGLYFLTRKSSAEPAPEPLPPPPPAPPPVPANIPATGVYAYLMPSPGGTLTVAKGSRVSTKVMGGYSFGSGKPYVSTSNPNVLTPLANASGDFYAAAPGVAVLKDTIKASDGGLYVGQVTVTVV